MSLLVGTGYSDNIDEPFEAGKESAEMALRGINGNKAGVAIVFASVNFELNELLKGIRSVTSDTPLIGCTTIGEMSNYGTLDDSVSIMLIHSDDLKFSIGVGSDADKDARASAYNSADTAMKNLGVEPKLAIALPDCSLTSSGLQVLEGFKEVLGKNFPIIGGAPGDDGKFKQTFQFYNEQILSNSIPILLIGGNLKVSIITQSGWTPLGNKAVCTKAQGSLVFEIDKKPAIEYFKSYVGEIHDAVAVANYPFAIFEDSESISMDEMEAKKYFTVRSPFFYKEDIGAIVCALPIPEGSHLKIARATRDDILQGAKNAASTVLKSFGDTKPKGIFFFSCGGRKQLLGIDTPKELKTVQEVLGNDIPLIGFYSYGEIGPFNSDIPHLSEAKFHNCTAVMCAIA